MNAVIETFGRVLYGTTNVGTANRRHSTVVIPRGGTLNASASSWMIALKRRENNNVAVSGNGGNGTVSTSSSYVLFEPLKNSASEYEFSGVNGQASSNAAELLVVPVSNDERGTMPTAVTVRRMSLAPEPWHSAIQGQQSAPPKQSASNNPAGGGKSRNRSGGTSAPRKPSIASTLLSVIAAPSATPANHSGTSPRRRQRQQQKQRSFEVHSPSTAAVSARRQQLFRQHQQHNSYCCEGELLSPTTGGERNDEEFCVIRRSPTTAAARSIAAPPSRSFLRRSVSPAQTRTDSARRRLMASQFTQKSEEVVEVFQHTSANPNNYANSASTMVQPGNPTSPSTQSTIFFGFIDAVDSCANDLLIGGGIFASNGFKREDQSLDRALAECNLIRAKEGLQQGLLLRCVDQKQMHSFLHYAVFKTSPPSSAPHPRSRSPSASPSSASPSRQPHPLNDAFPTNAHWNKVLGELRAGSRKSPATLFSTYEELFAIQKSGGTGATEPPQLTSTRHSGYIVVSFKLLDENYKQNSLEQSWMSWTGAREIYKYSPRTWNLRRITLHRHAPATTAGGARPFAYVLVCEFGNILHPSNTLAALDICERLRARNCGHIALYQVQHCYSPASPSPYPVSAQGLSPRDFRSRPQAQQQFYQGQGGQGRTSPSPPPPCPTSNRFVGQFGQPPVPPHPQQQQQQQSTSPWSSPKLALAAVQRREQMMSMRGYSQDVDTAHETHRRRATLLRMRDRSLGYDTLDNAGGSGSPGANSMNNAFLLSQLGGSAASVAPRSNYTPPRGQTPTGSALALNLNNLTPPTTARHFPQTFPGPPYPGYGHQFAHQQELSNV